MSDSRTIPANTYQRVCRRCGQAVFEASTVTFGALVRFDPAPSPAGCVRINPDGTAVYLSPADEAAARALGEPLYQSHAQSCAAPARDTGGEG